MASGGGIQPREGVQGGQATALWILALKCHEVTFQKIIERHEETDRGEKREGRGRKGEERMRGEAWLVGSGGGTESERNSDTTTVASRNQMASVSLTLHITSLPTTVTNGFLARTQLFQIRTPNV